MDDDWDKSVETHGVVDAIEVAAKEITDAISQMETEVKKRISDDFSYDRAFRLGANQHNVQFLVVVALLGLILWRVW